MVSKIQTHTKTLEGRYPLKPHIYQALNIEGLYRKEGTFKVKYTNKELLNALEALQEIDGTNDEQRFLIDTMDKEVELEVVFKK